MGWVRRQAARGLGPRRSRSARSLLGWRGCITLPPYLYRESAAFCPAARPSNQNWRQFLTVEAMKFKSRENLGTTIAKFPPRIGTVLVLDFMQGFIVKCLCLSLALEDVWADGAGQDLAELHPHERARRVTGDAGVE